jgi:hypothetical protein
MDTRGQIYELTELPSFPVSHPKAIAVPASETLIPQGATLSLVLNGQAIHQGDVLAVRVLGSWITGEVRQDPTGWYLQTVAQVGIRLSGGLWARRETKQRREQEG